MKSWPPVVYELNVIRGFNFGVKFIVFLILGLESLRFVSIEGNFGSI